MGKGKEMSPAEAYRKQQRKKELERKKRQRDAFKGLKELKDADVGSVRAELVRLQQLDREGHLDSSRRFVMQRVTELYQQKLVENSSGGGVQHHQPHPMNKRPLQQQQNIGPVPPSLKKMRLTPLPPSTSNIMTGCGQTAPIETEIVIGTGGLMPTALRVKRTCAPAPPKKKPEEETEHPKEQKMDPSIPLASSESGDHNDNGVGGEVAIGESSNPNSSEEKHNDVAKEKSSGKDMENKHDEKDADGNDAVDDDDVLAQFEEEMKELGAL